MKVFATIWWFNGPRDHGVEKIRGYSFENVSSLVSDWITLNTHKDISNIVIFRDDDYEEELVAQEYQPRLAS